MVSQAGRELWVGLNDKADEGVWRFPTDSTHFDPNYDVSVFRWESGEPNNSWGDEHCVFVKDSGRLNDKGCSNGYHGLCEVKVFDC